MRALSTWNRAGLGVTWLSLLFYAYGPVNGWWLESELAKIEQQAAKPAGLPRNPQLLQSALWLLLLLLGLAALRKLRDPAGRSRRRAPPNLMSFLLMGLLALQWAAHAFSGRAVDSEPGPRAATSASMQARRGCRRTSTTSSSTATRAPTCSRSTTSIDNGPFLDGLRARGFQVSNASHSNYNWTFLSLASSLNLDYMQPLIGDQRWIRRARDRDATYRLLRDNRAAALPARTRLSLRSPAVHLGRHGHESVRRRVHSPATPALFAERIPARDRGRQLAARAERARQHGRRHTATCTTSRRWREQAQTPGPKFVFAHFVPPHHPYLFDREGHVLRRATCPTSSSSRSGSGRIASPTSTSSCT